MVCSQSVVFNLLSPNCQAAWGTGAHASALNSKDTEYDNCRDNEWELASLV